jgi:hypothetical protein
LNGIFLPPQSGTDACENVAVPHTGNAVEGVCPGFVQGVCAHKPAHTKHSKKSSAPLKKADIIFSNQWLKYQDSVFAGIKEFAKA